MKEELINAIKEAFDYHVTAWTNETVLGLECGIDGKEDFIEEVRKLLNEKQC